MHAPALSREQLQDVLRAGRGDLQDTPYPILLLALAVYEKTAVLTLRREPLQKEIVFDGGSPVDCRSNIATETLGRFLVSAGKLREEDYQQASSLSASRGVPIEEIITERKLLSPTEVYRALQQSLGRKLLEPFSWKTGTYEISEDVPATESALHVKVPQLILTGILKVEAQEAADEAVSKGKFLTLGTDPLFEIDDLRLGAEQQKVVDAARRGAPLDEFDSDDATRIIYALLLLGVVALSQQPQAAIPHFELDHPFRAPTVEAPAPPPPPKPQPAAPAAANAEEVIAAYMAHRRKDAFELLDVPETAGPVEFNRAYLRVAEQFSPWRFEEKTADGLRDKAREIFLAAARAYGELMDLDRREKLIKQRAQKRAAAERPTLIQPAAKPAAAQPIGLAKGALIDPEALYRNGRDLATAGKLREALSSFELAAESDAQNGTYAAEVAWCRFQLMATPATIALKLLKNAMRIDPRSGVAHLYAGKVATALGNKVEAESYLNRAAMLMPRDMRVVEALKALR